jgi:hypothetical protein
MNVYADDVVIVARSKKINGRTIKIHEGDTNEVELIINQEKTKYLEINAKRSSINRNTNVVLGQHNFERVQTISFLGLIINGKDVNSEEIMTRIKKGNKAFFMNRKLLSSKLNGKQSIYVCIYIHTHTHIHYKAQCNICC